jgi:hypothetical protein
MTEARQMTRPSFEQRRLHMNDIVDRGVLELKLSYIMS